MTNLEIQEDQDDTGIQGRSLVKDTVTPPGVGDSNNHLIDLIIDHLIDLTINHQVTTPFVLMEMKKEISGGYCRPGPGLEYR